VNHPGFGPAWRDPALRTWIPLLGSFDTVALKPDANDEIVDSAATRACAAVGGRLPTMQDFAALVKYFEQHRRRITERGRLEFLSLYPSFEKRYFWTSSLVSKCKETPQSPSSCAYAVDFLPEIFGGRGYLKRDRHAPVVCVSQPEVIGPALPVPGPGQYVTTVGAVFTRVTLAGFGEGWRDPSGRIWSGYQGEFVNEGAIAGNTVVESDATRACSRIGAMLPSSEDVFQLVGYLDLDGTGHFTERAERDFAALFPEQGYLGHGHFWTSTLEPDRPWAAGVYRTDFGWGYSQLRRNQEAVRCVRK
jgi:hypothetical protein